MKIKQIVTTRFQDFENLLWVEVFSDEGPVGLGETYFNPQSVETYIHEYIAPRILGKDPTQIEKISRQLIGYLGFRNSGVEIRGNSAIDLALWDLWGKTLKQPVWKLLGGKFRDRIPTYNTCAGSNYVLSAKQQTSSNWGTEKDKGKKYDDLNGFLNYADELAQDLLSEGIKAMKIWPFDLYAEPVHGNHISLSDLKKAISPFEKIRKAVGDEMEIMVEFHSLWKLNPAIRIATALEDFNTFWHEDPIKMDSLSCLKQYAHHSKATVCASETLSGTHSYKDLFELNFPLVVMPDLSWCGGMTEAKRIASMAETWKFPIAPHDCTGPIVFTASCHLSLNCPNAIYQESVRAFYNTWYKDLIEDGPVVKDGHISLNDKPGWGISVNQDSFSRLRILSKKSSF